MGPVSDTGAMSEPIPIVVPASGVVEVFLLLEWMAEAGATVAAGDDIVLLESEKSELALEAPASGTLEILIHPDPDADVEVEVGSTIGRIVT
jgi:pyruvate/2-oxoglutarate dehydrogenase complex dihydrolipoamide acyltransferase (E2) component